MTAFVHEGRRAYVVLFAVFAMIAALLAIPATPANAVATDACPSTVPSAGFTDLAGFSVDVVDAANCLALYGITKGTSATTYGPSASVSRWQMALFLTRQAEDHGVTLPSGAPQGFTDLAGLSAEAVVAINQLAQLNITKGTSATTFDPNGNVGRWQMALFITRLVTGAGITLPSGADQGFTDISGLSAEAQLAINQTAQLAISKGTTATTFDPTGLVTRAQMALFLTRTLQAGGVTPPTGAAGQVTVTPATDVTLADGAARAYTATFKNADGSLYSGYVGIELLDASTTNAAVYNSTPTDVLFESVDGTVYVSDEWNGFAGTDGAVSFIVRDGAATAATDVVPVAWIDLDGDNGYETSGNVAPTEPFGLGGVADFSGAAPAEAANGAFAGVVVDSVDAAGDSFASATATYEYDSNDIFQIQGANTDLAGFEAALSETDVVNGVYNGTVANVSTFNIATDNTAASTLKVTDPSAAKSIDSNNYVIKGTGNAGYLVAAYVDSTNDGVKTAGEAKLAEATIAADGSWSLTVPLQQNAVNDFVVTQRASSSTVDTGTGVQVPLITEGAPAAAKITSSTGANVAPSAAGVLGPNDTITIVFNEEVVGVGTGDTIAIIDQDGSTATLTSGSDATFALDAAGTTLTVTITNFVFASGGTTTGIQPAAQITAVSGFQGDDGLAINVSGSGSGRVFSGF